MFKKCPGEIPLSFVEESRRSLPRTNVASTETRPTSLDKGERAQQQVRGNLSANNRDELSAGDIVAGEIRRKEECGWSGFGNLSFHYLYFSNHRGGGRAPLSRTLVKKEQCFVHRGILSSFETGFLAC